MLSLPLSTEGNCSVMNVMRYLVPESQPMAATNGTDTLVISPMPHKTLFHKKDVGFFFSLSLIWGFLRKHKVKPDAVKEKKNRLS